jgi:hypothetical protein
MHPNICPVNTLCQAANTIGAGYNLCF